jgi:hypothetical protein
VSEILVDALVPVVCVVLVPPPIPCVLDDPVVTPLAIDWETELSVEDPPV